MFSLMKLCLDLLPCVTKWKMYKWRKNCTLVSCLFLDLVSHFFSWHYIWAICLVFDLKTDIVVQRLILFIMIRYVTVYSLKKSYSFQTFNCMLILIVEFCLLRNSQLSWLLLTCLAVVFSSSFLPFWFYWLLNECNLVIAYWLLFAL